MKNGLLSLLLTLALLSLTVECYSPDDAHVLACTLDDNGTHLEPNLSQLWAVLTLQDPDKFAFLLFCPILLFIQIVVLITYIKHPQLRVKPGNIFCGLVVIEMGLTLHLFANAVYRTVNDSKTAPPSLIYFCSVSSIIFGFFVMIHFMYLIMFMFYTIFLFRFSLKKKSQIFWKTLHAFVVIVSLGMTIFFYFQQFMGLNFYGICGLTTTRKLGWTPMIPSLEIICSVIFACMGCFTFWYFRKHMPEGFRHRKLQESKIIFMYVTGFSLIEILMSFMSLILEINCMRTTPIPQINVMVTATNFLRLIQFAFLIFLIIFNQRFRKKFKHTLKSMFVRKRWKGQNMSETIEMQDIIFNQKLLQMKQSANQIDLLNLSQIYTIISGIYIAYFQYFRDLRQKQPLRRIHFRQRISFSIDNLSTMQYQTKARRMVKLKILPCNIIIHSPKVFIHILDMDKLSNVYESFHIVDNSRKLSNLVEGKGGKSGEFFFFSSNNQYVIKTLTDEEFYFLEDNLQTFYDYFQQNPNSLLAKILGLFTIQGDEMQRKYKLILMKNILGCSREQILRLYDLKGSKYDRQVLFTQVENNEALPLTLKDVDFILQQKVLNISKQKAEEIRQIIRKDTHFLKSLNLLDYSLLVVKVRWKGEPEDSGFWGQLQRIPDQTNPNVYYHIGLIDYMQKWDLQKKSEKWWKSMTGKKDVSAEEPNLYQRRFVQFVDEITGLSSLNQSVEMKQARAITDPETSKQLIFQSRFDLLQSKTRGFTDKI